MSDYDKIRRSCLKRGELYEDQDFSAVQASVFYHQTPPFQFVWKRPKELTNNPVFVQDSSSQFDIGPGKLGLVQTLFAVLLTTVFVFLTILLYYKYCYKLAKNSIGDRWLVSCMGCLSSTRGLFYRVVPADQNFNTEEYAGIFRFRVWWCGEWQEVIVDDRLPTVNNKLVFIHPQHSSQFWAPLLEKAYAKLHGSYEALKYGCSLDGLADLTGGITEGISIRQDPTACSRLINKLLVMTSVVTAIAVQQQTQTRNQAEKLANGILLGINYRVMAVEKVETLKGDHIQLVRLRNPLGVPEYVGSWSRDSDEWSNVPADEKERLNIKGLVEGEFWIGYQDFVKTFGTLEVIHLDGETSKDEPSLRTKTPWYMKLWHSAWQKGVTAGGCRNNADTFHINPQFQLILPDVADVVISLSQHAVLEPRVIGFTAYESNKTNDNNNKSYFKKNKSFLSSQYSNSRQVCNHSQIEKGTYLVIPTTFEPGQEAGFTLRVYSTKTIKLKLIDTTPSLVKSAMLKAPPSFDSKISSYEGMFLQLADEHKTVNAFELQELLEVCLPNDYVKSCATLEVCRQVVLALETTGTGRLKFCDYKNLMCSLKYWQTIFKNYTKGTSGVLRSEKLRDAILDIGFQLNTDTLALLVLRYMRKDGTLRFGDFVSCILHLTAAFNAFEKKDPLQNGYIKLNLADWLKSTLLC